MYLPRDVAVSKIAMEVQLCLTSRQDPWILTTRRHFSTRRERIRLIRQRQARVHLISNHRPLAPQLRAWGLRVALLPQNALAGVLNLLKKIKLLPSQAKLLQISKRSQRSVSHGRELKCNGSSSYPRSILLSIK